MAQIGREFDITGRKLNELFQKGILKKQILTGKYLAKKILNFFYGEFITYINI